MIVRIALGDPTDPPERRVEVTVERAVPPDQLTRMTELTAVAQLAYELGARFGPSFRSGTALLHAVIHH